jgi:hypothetical protein
VLVVVESYAIEADVVEAADEVDLWRANGNASARWSVAAWRITHGRVTGVDVSGQVLAVVSAVSRGCGDEGLATHLVVLDEGASPEQTVALLDLFQGRLGGAVVAPVPGARRLFCQIPLRAEATGAATVVSASGHLRLAVDGLGIAEVAVSLPDQGLAWRAAVPATSRHVRLQHPAPTPPSSVSTRKEHERWTATP